MVDLDDAGRRLAAHRVGPTTPISTVQARARRRRQRRQMRRALAVAGLAVVVAAVAVVSVRSSSSGRSKPQQVNVVGGPNRPVTLPAVTHPRGWMPSDIGRVRVWTPPNWSYCYTDDNRSLSGTFASSLAGCPQSGPAPLAIRPAGPTSGLAKTSVNGLAVWEGTVGRGADIVRTYEVPSLGVRLIAVGSIGQQVARTLGPSTLSAVLATRYPVAVPVGWKSVEFDGVAARVPASWPVRHLTGLPLEDPKQELSGCTLFTSSVVYVGHVPGVCTGTISSNFASALWLGNSDSPNVTASTKLSTGAADTVVVVRYDPSSTPSYDLDLTVTTGHGAVEGTLGLGTDPVTAEEILSSLRPSP